MRTLIAWWRARRELRRHLCPWCRARLVRPGDYCSPECADEAAAWRAIH